jgi:large subunit ribosomal protein L25
MAEITLQATSGRPTGTGPAKRLRVEGKIPAVVYGLGADPLAITVEWRPLREALTTDAGLNAVIDLHIDGKAGELAVVKELQRHPIRGDVLHVDFLRVSADAEISVDVPIVLEGEAKAVLDEDGVVDHHLHALTINAKPANIPNELVVDISALEIGGTIHVSDIKLPSGVSTDVDPEELVVSAAHAQLEVPEETEGEGAEGEAAEGDTEAGAEGEAEGAEGGDAEGGEAAAEGDAEG